MVKSYLHKDLVNQPRTAHGNEPNVTRRHKVGLLVLIALGLAVHHGYNRASQESVSRYAVIGLGLVLGY